MEKLRADLIKSKSEDEFILCLYHWIFYEMKVNDVIVIDELFKPEQKKARELFIKVCKQFINDNQFKPKYEILFNNNFTKIKKI